MKVVKLFDEVALMNELLCDTVQLIHATSLVRAIKILVTIHEIIDLNLEVQKRFMELKDEPVWDISALQDLKMMRRELNVYHKVDFDPTKLLEIYTKKMGALFHAITIREAS